MARTDNVSDSELMFARGMLSALLSFSQRSGMTVGCGADTDVMNTSDRLMKDPYYATREAYEKALTVSIYALSDLIGMRDHENP